MTIKPFNFTVVFIIYSHLHKNEPPQTITVNEIVIADVAYSFTKKV